MMSERKVLTPTPKNKKEKEEKMVGQQPATVVEPIVSVATIPPKKISLLNYLLIFAFTFSVMFGVMGGTIYYIIKNNINNVAEKNRTSLSKMPIIKYALPAPKNPDGEENFSEKEIRLKYTEVLKNRNELRDKVQELTQKLPEIEKLKQENMTAKTESVNIKGLNEGIKADLEKQKQQLAEDKKKFDSMVVSKDVKGFKEFFQKMDKEQAKLIYEQVMKEQKADQATVKVAKVFEGMEAATSAKILQEIGNDNVDFVVNILKNMKKDMSAEVLAAMDSKFAANVSQKLEDSYK